MTFGVARPRTFTEQREVWTIAVAVWLTCVFIGPGYEVANFNVVPRMGLVFSVIQNHSLSIGQFADLSPDKAMSAGLYYNDKAPGLSFLAILPVWVLVWIGNIAGLGTAPIADGKLTQFYSMGGMVATAFTVSVLTAWCAACMYSFARRLGASKGAAAFGCLAYAFGSPALGWGTVFFGHGAAGAALFIGMSYVALASSEGRTKAGVVWDGVVAGGALSWAVVIEYTCAPAAAAIAVWGLALLYKLPARSILLSLAGAVGMGLLTGLLLLLYNHLAFGSAFRLGYSSVVGFEGMNQGFLGIAAPKLDVLVQIIAGPYRGLLQIAPVLLLVPFGYVAAARFYPAGLTVLLLLVPAIFLLINSGYYYWDGGGSTGPRHITPALPFMAFALVPLWDRTKSKIIHATFALLLALSAAVSIIAASVTMAAPNARTEGMLGWLWGRFVNGDIHNALVFTDRFTISSLHGSARLITLLALPLCWAAAVGVVSLTFKRQRRAG